MIVHYLLFALAGIFLAVASLLSESWAGLGAAIMTAALFAWLAPRTPALKRGLFLGGVVFTGIAFYWLPSTLSLFGGFPVALSYLIFALFCLASALQFWLVGLFYQRVHGTVWQKLGLALPAAWVSAELLVPRLFPWAIGHAVVPWTSMAALAELGGVPLMSALVMMWGQALAACAGTHRGAPGRRYAAAVLVVSVALALCGGMLNERVRTRLAAAPPLKVGTVQGNLDVFQKRDIRYFMPNLRTYQALSRRAVEEGAELVIWPETVINEWIPDTLPSLAGIKLDPRFDESTPLLFGALSYHVRGEEELEELYRDNPELRSPEYEEIVRALRYNSAIGIAADGTVVGRYHKRVLMPFGEYVPFSDILPALKLMLPMVAEFARGTLTEPISFALPPAAGGSEPREARVSSLICYEDLIPALSREAVAKGANLLVNLTNDAWYGDTAAPKQHHLLALWRAVETRRFLLRSTNTGLTALVDPFGRSIRTLPTFAEAYFTEEVRLLDGSTFYSTAGDIPAWCVCGLLLFTAARRKPRAEHRSE